MSKEQITLIETGKAISEDSDIVHSLNSKSENITEPIIKIILKYTNHLSILTIREVCKERFASPFSFSEVCKEEILKHILNLDTSMQRRNTET